MQEVKKPKKSSNSQRNSHNSEEYPELSEYTLLNVLGSGSFGKVYRAMHKENKTECAIKIIEKNHVKNHDVYRLLSETKILSSLNHKNIVMFLNAQETKEHIFIFMECINSGSLSDLMNAKIQNNENFTDLEASQIMKSILKAVKYIHEKDIVHRDLKPANILIENINDFSSVKITDFGLSAMISEYSSKFFTEQCGTPMYMAPELIENKVYSKPVDIWSCGMIMYWLLNRGTHPFNTRSKEDLIKEIIKCEWQFPSTFSEMAIDFFIKLTSKQPGARYIAEQALTHPWITRDFKSNIPLTFEEKYHLFIKETEILNLLKSVFFCVYLQKLLAHQKNSYNHLSIPSNNAKKYKIITRPKSLTTGNNDFIIGVNPPPSERKPLITTPTACINTIQASPIQKPAENFKLQLISTSPEKSHIRIRSIPAKEGHNIENISSVNTPNFKDKSKLSNSLHTLSNKDSVGKEKSPIKNKLVSANNNNSSTSLHNKAYQTTTSKFNDNDSFVNHKSTFDRNSLKSSSKPRLIPSNISNFKRSSLDDEEVKLNNATPHKDYYTQSKSPQKKAFLTNTSHLYVKSQTNSPAKLKSALKSPRDLNDIDIDKESLMQLNRATNQFFSKKVKETIQNSMIFQKPNTSEKKNNVSLDDTTYSIKSLDIKDRSLIFNKDLGDAKSMSFMRNLKPNSPLRQENNIFVENGNMLILPLINNNRMLKNVKNFQK